MPETQVLASDPVGAGTLRASGADHDRRRAQLERLLADADADALILGMASHVAWAPLWRGPAHRGGTTYAELLAGQQELCARLGYPDAWRDHWQGGQPVDTDQGSVEVAGLLVR